MLHKLLAEPVSNGTKGGVILAAKIFVVYWQLEGMVHDRCQGNSELQGGIPVFPERQAMFAGSIAICRF